MSKIICTACKVEKSIDEFYYDKSRNYYDPKCKKCSCEQAKIFRLENLEKFAEKDKVFHKKNRDKRLEYAREYYIENQDEIIRKNTEYSIKNREVKNARQRERRKNPIVKLRRGISNSIRIILKSQNLKKEHSSIKNLPYTIEELKSHIEKQFKEPGNEWMNWENWGQYIKNTWDDNDSSTWTWNIDHIIPQADLVYDDMNHPNFFKCWDLNNLRPYSAKQNIIDQARKHPAIKRK